MESIGTWWVWLAFFAIVLVMLATDLRARRESLDHPHMKGESQ